MGLKINGSTSGSIEIDVPAAVGSDVTGVLLPSAAGTLDRLERAGNVLKLETATGGDLANITSTSFTATNTAVSITPSAAGSKILIFGAIRVGSYDSDQTFIGSDTVSNLAIYRATTSIKEFNVITGEFNQVWDTVPVAYVDTPTYTLGDSITYTIYARMGSSGDNYIYVDHSTKSEIIALEVAA